MCALVAGATVEVVLDAHTLADFEGLLYVRAQGNYLLQIRLIKLLTRFSHGKN